MSGALSVRIAERICAGICSCLCRCDCLCVGVWLRLSLLRAVAVSVHRLLGLSLSQAVTVTDSVSVSVSVSRSGGDVIQARRSARVGPAQLGQACERGFEVSKVVESRDDE